MILEPSPTHSHQSMGGVERFHRSLQEECRVLKTMIEQKLGVEYPRTVPAVAWLVRHAAWLWLRFHVPCYLGSSGFARLRGRSHEGGPVTFGETVMLRRSGEVGVGGQKFKWQNRWC